MRFLNHIARFTEFVYSNLCFGYQDNTLYFHSTIKKHTGELTMRITTLLGSAKKKGNTATVLGWVEEELKSLGHDVERIYLNNKSISW